MICFNGEIINSKEFSLNHNNRYLLYGDGFFETIKYIPNKILFWEEHYFRIMGSLCMLRFNIPDYFNESYFIKNINKTILSNKLEKYPVRIKILFYRESKGLYRPKENKLSFLISCEPLNIIDYSLNKKGLSVDIFNDYKLGLNSLNNLKTSNKIVNVLSSFYNDDKNIDDCLFINEKNNIVESSSGNIFILLNNYLITPPLESGCINGVMRKFLINNSKKFNLKIKEENISSSDLFNAEEIFFTNVISCVNWVKNFRKKEYNNSYSIKIINQINEII
ncbi:MAG: hypothetical protein CBC73_05535 [Flavobacteriales bacterium TMED113]|nr:MAG: hypothetical protein CBC73_05535 [Flavobacteriales bacterium TMED113]